MSRWPLPDRLNLLLVAAVLFTAWGPLCFNSFDGPHGPGRDMIQFHTAGSIVNAGQADRLYDQDFFQEAQRPLIGDTIAWHSLYPPLLALLAAPWARLPYPAAQVVCWAAEAAGFLLAGWMCYRWIKVPPRWRVTAMLALAAMFPLWVALRLGQLTPLWLLAVLGGILLHQRGRCMSAGVLISLLALKPQLAAPLVLWLLMRRDWRALGGVALGLLLQALAVVTFLGPGVPLNYLRALPTIIPAGNVSRFTPAFERSVLGTASNILWTFGYRHTQAHGVAHLLQVIVLVLSGGFLLQAVRAHRRLQRRGAAPEYAPHYEYACAVLFLALGTPHLLLYDAALLAVPIVALWSTPAWRLGLVLYFSVTLAAAFLDLALGFSLGLFLMFWVLYRVAHDLDCLERGTLPAQVSTAAPPLASPA
jgi:hypothetical protein